ncbi:MAG: hypothetical protein L3J49_05660 [Desulfobulbaceae bacterium]|nr:hypothetical protein [Desulfobulbaceae bacterium]
MKGGKKKRRYDRHEDCSLKNQRFAGSSLLCFCAQRCLESFLRRKMQGVGLLTGVLLPSGNAGLVNQPVIPSRFSDLAVLQNNMDCMIAYLQGYVLGQAGKYFITDCFVSINL